jgi:hypothetical protein
MKLEFQKTIVFPNRVWEQDCPNPGSKNIPLPPFKGGIGQANRIKSPLKGDLGGCNRLNFTWITNSK